MAKFNIFDHTMTGVSLDSGEDVFVASSGSLIGGIGMNGTPTTVGMVIDGYVARISLSDLRFTGEIFIGETGHVGETDRISVITLFDNDNYDPDIFIQNAGRITATELAIYNESNGSTLLANSGSISADEIILTSGALDLTNTGSIVATGASTSSTDAFDAVGFVRLVNSGDILFNNTSTSGRLIESDSSVTISNDGSMVSNANGVYAGTNITFNNTGTFSALNRGLSSGSGIINVDNSGIIQTGDFAVSGHISSADASIRNSGTIIADEVLRYSGTGEARLSNSGSIFAEQLIGTNGAGADIEVVNSGTIEQSVETGSDLIAIAVGGGSTGWLKNTGTMVANQTLFDGEVSNFRIVNDGYMEARASLIDLSSFSTTLSNNYVTNSGLMTAVGPVLLMSRNSNMVINNSGEMVSTTTSGTLGGSNIQGQITIINSGTIEGRGNNTISLTNDSGVTAGHVLRNSGEIGGNIRLADGGDSVINSGSIIGDVDLQSGNNTLFNTGDILGDVDMESGNDVYRASAEGTVFGTIDLGNGDNIAWGGDGNDIFVGGSGIDEIRGGGGDDDITGGSGNDILFGKAGDDILRGNAGADRMLGDQGNDELIGGDGDDEIFGGAGDDILNGEVGNDELRGGDGQDLLQGFQGNDQLFGGFGDDTLEGGGGNDGLRGGQGDDFIWGAAGDDRIEGGAGIDTVQYTGDASNFTFELLSSGNIRVTDNVGNNGVDLLTDVELVKFVGGGDAVDIMDLI